VVVVRDLEASLRFYRDALGLDLLQDRQVEGDWPDLFGAPSRRVHAVFLGDAGVPDDHAGVLELNVFDGDVPEGPPPSPPRTGFFLLSFFVDVEATLGKLAALGLGGPPRRITQSTPAQAGDPGDRARPRRAAYLAHPRFDHQERVTT
jgi:glyoxylase I family protein